MAGGRGERLKALTEHRCKPATPFGGKFRIVDFVLSNCVNSGIRQISILTQYKAQSLIQHVERGWSYLRGEFGEFIEMIPAQQQVGPHWYRGTADAVYQNLELILSHRPKHVLVLAGDHIYKMDYGPMIAYHVEKGADITVGVVEVPRDQSHPLRRADRHRMESRHRVRREAGEPGHAAEPARTRSSRRWASTYSTRSCSRSCCCEDAADEKSSHDFGKDILPKGIGNLQVFAYPFQDVKTRAQSYWRDVGTIDAFYDANLELVHVRPELNIYDEEWPIWTYQEHQPPAKFILDEDTRRGIAHQLDGVRRLHHLRRRRARVAHCFRTCASKSAPPSSAR